MKIEKLILFLIPLLFLSSCSLDWHDDKDTKVIELEKQNQELKRENANLKENQSLINAWWIPTDIQPTEPTWWTKVVNPLFPEWTTFEESDSTVCMKKAKDSYLAAWIKKCKSLGYTDTQIQKDECQLENSFINQLKTTRTIEEWKCGPQ